MKKELGQTNRKLFRRSFQKAKLCEFKDDFYLGMERIEDTIELIPSEVDVWNEYGLPGTVREGLLLQLTLRICDFLQTFET